MRVTVTRTPPLWSPHKLGRRAKIAKSAPSLPLAMRRLAAPMKAATATAATAATVATWWLLGAVSVALLLLALRTSRTRFSRVFARALHKRCEFLPSLSRSGLLHDELLRQGIIVVFFLIFDIFLM